MANDWSAELTMDYNCWFQQVGVLMQFLKTPFTPAQFEDFQKQTQMDTHSIVAEPGFVNVERLDFRLSEGSPARKLADAAWLSAGSGKRLGQ